MAPHLDGRIPDDRVTAADLIYWENFYANGGLTRSPSPFAIYCGNRFLRPGDSVFEAGCGNGRDAAYLASKGCRVLAVDQCSATISRLTVEHAGAAGLSFAAGDFTVLAPPGKLDAFYSRFTLHAIGATKANELVTRVARSLAPSGLMLLEFRGLLNELCGKGEPVLGEPGMFMLDGHRRRFIDTAALASQIESSGLRIAICEEKPGFSPFNGTDETFARIVARKP